MSNLEKHVENVASQPKSYENDGEKITNHSLPELIEADRHIKRCKSGKNPWKALKLVKISTQGPGK